MPQVIISLLKKKKKSKDIHHRIWWKGHYCVFWKERGSTISGFIIDRTSFHHLSSLVAKGFICVMYTRCTWSQQTDGGDWSTCGRVCQWSVAWVAFECCLDKNNEKSFQLVNPLARRPWISWNLSQRTFSAHHRHCLQAVKVLSMTNQKCQGFRIVKETV